MRCSDCCFSTGLLGAFKPGAWHPVTPAPIKALSCLCLLAPMAEKSKPPALRVVGTPGPAIRARRFFYFPDGSKLDFINFEKKKWLNSVYLLQIIYNKYFIFSICYEEFV
jgi:hypothetical protein